MCHGRNNALLGITAGRIICVHGDLVGEQFEQGLRRYEGTVLAVVHDRYFIERFATRLWAIHDRGIRSYVDLEDMRRGVKL